MGRPIAPSRFPTPVPAVDLGRQHALAILTEIGESDRGVVWQRGRHRFARQAVPNPCRLIVTCRHEAFSIRVTKRQVIGCEVVVAITKGNLDFGPSE